MLKNMEHNKQKGGKDERKKNMYVNGEDRDFERKKGGRR